MSIPYRRFLDLPFPGCGALAQSTPWQLYRAAAGASTVSATESGYHTPCAQHNFWRIKTAHPAQGIGQLT